MLGHLVAFWTPESKGCAFDLGWNSLHQTRVILEDAHKYCNAAAG